MSTSEGRVLKGVSWVVLVFVLIQAAGLLYASVIQARRFERIFLDFNVALPGATMLVLSLSRTFVLPLAVMVLAALAVVKELVFPWPASRVIANVVLLGVLWVFGLFMTVALHLPLMHFVQLVQGGR